MSYQFSLAVTPDTEQADAQGLANLCRALAHPARIRIIRHLLTEDRCVCGRIVEALPLAQSTVSQHLKILKEVELIHGEVEGPKTCYCVNKTRLASICTSLSALLNCADIR